MGSGGIAPRVLNCGTRWRWVVSFTPWFLYSWYPLDSRLGGPHKPPERAFPYRESNSGRPIRIVVTIMTELSWLFVSGVYCSLNICFQFQVTWTNMTTPRGSVSVSVDNRCLLPSCVVILAHSESCCSSLVRAPVSRYRGAEDYEWGASGAGRQVTGRVAPSH
jgi:hypothetical protein